MRRIGGCAGLAAHAFGLGIMSREVDFSSDSWRPTDSDLYSTYTRPRWSSPQPLVPLINPHLGIHQLKDSLLFLCFTCPRL